MNRIGMDPPEGFNVQICTPTAGNVKAAYCTSVLGMILHYLRTPIFLSDETMTRQCQYNLMIGSTICASREKMVMEALADDEITHLLFIDDDMGFAADALNVALQADEPIVLANYRMKSPPWRFTCVRKADDGYHEVRTTDRDQAIEDVTYGGFGFCLIRMDVLQKVQPPRFLPQYHAGSANLYTTEDLPFFESCAAVGYTPKVCHKLSQRVWHVGDFAYHYSTTFTSSTNGEQRRLRINYESYTHQFQQNAGDART